MEENLNKHIISPEGEQNFEFIRLKSLGRGTLVSIYSQIKVQNQVINLYQEKRYFYFIKRVFNTSMNISDIKSMSVKKTIDVSDLIFVTIFCLLGLIEYLYFIPGLIFLWVGLCYKMEMFDIKNYKIEIPSETKSNCIDFIKEIENIKSSKKE